MTIRWVVGVASRDGYLLITKLKQKNMLIPRMDWFFPFAELKEGESPRVCIKKLFMDELGINATVGQLLLRHVPSENPKIEQLFYEIKPNRNLVILGKEFSLSSWIKPNQVLKFFTTTLSSELMDYLRSLEETGKGYIIK
jgi:hypothetical protein